MLSVNILMVLIKPKEYNNILIMDDIKKLFGKRIKSFRELKNFTQGQFAEKINIAEVTLSKIERGVNFVTPQTLEKIVKVLEIKPYQLFIEAENLSDEAIWQDLTKMMKSLRHNGKNLRIIHDFVQNLLEK